MMVTGKSSDIGLGVTIARLGTTLGVREDEWMRPQYKKEMEEEDTRSVFFKTTPASFHMACGFGGPLNEVCASLHVNSLPFMCFRARRGNWDIARGIGTMLQRFSHKNSISAQSDPQLEQRPQFKQLTLACN